MKLKAFELLRRTVAGLLVLVMVAGAIPATHAEDATSAQPQPEDSGIRELDGVSVDYTGSLDGSKVFRLPDTIGKDQAISIIIRVDNTTVLEAYNGTDKTMSLAQFTQQPQAQSVRRDIQAKKADVLSRLEEKGIAYTLGEDFDTLIAGFEVVIRGGDFEALGGVLTQSETAIIGEEYHRQETQLVENTVNVYDTGIFDSSNVPYDGSGMVVAVLDTGLDSNHTAFSTANFTSQKLGLTYEEVAAVIGSTQAAELFEGLSVDDVYINEKVPFGFDYSDRDPDVYSTHNNHGTHVSGVIVGKDDVITGVAPNAQLVSMKIFSDVMDTARSAWILAALEDCAVLNVDVINMSLGTSCGFSREQDNEEMNAVYDTLRSQGISVVAAASNSYSSAYGSEANGNLPLTSNPDTGTVGSPSTFPGVLSVASISGTETPYLKYGETIIYFDETNTGAAEENDFVMDLLGQDKTELEIEFVLVPGVGRSADYTGLDVAGKIALVRRGDNTFEEKAIIAQNQGAAGIIIYNNVSGEVKMNVGDATLAACSISQDDGEMLVATGGGKLKISREQTSGPFISDFSSWGPTPSLEIKPEITGHGGNILSSITGGGYDRLSGTSMACPNLAGVVVLLRQYVVENFPEIAGDNTKVSDMVYQLLMSTADIALGMNGQPYAVRKQGAGLANLYNATQTPAYITTLDENGNAMPMTKLELGDDPAKSGVYTMHFNLNNIGTTSLTYDLGAYVMTEGVSETKTNAGETTVTEEAYILTGATVKVDAVSGGTQNGNAITVAAGQSASVTVTITLGDADKQYLNDSFANGMYVEGYLTLTATAGTEIDLNIPYLAFFGDWTVAPLFDLEYYDTNADEMDEGLNEEDKLKPDAYATRLIGGLQGDYVSYLGTYYFLQDDKDMDIPANKAHISLSNQEGTIHALRFAWTGLLRNAAKVVVTITNDATGEVVYRTEDVGVRKSYGDGGTPYPANVEIEFDTTEYNLPNNSKYTVRMEGYLDYGDGGLQTNEKNVYEFPLTMDFQAPAITGTEFYTQYDKTEKINRLFAKVAIYDNHYAMSAQLGYVTNETDADGNVNATLKPFEQYMTPIYSQENSTTYVTFELTDYIYQLKAGSLNTNTFVITCYDYALNYATYEIDLPDDFQDFYLENVTEEEGITLSPNEILALEPLVDPVTQWSELLEYTTSKPGVVRIVNNKLVAVAPGVARIKIRDPQTNKSQIVKVTVLGEGDEGYRRYDKPVADAFELTGYYTVKAYYMLSSEDKKIGDSGDSRFFEGNYSLEMYPSESVALIYRLSAYFPADTKVVYESGNENIVKVSDAGVVTAVAEGYASVTVKVLQDDKSTYYSETVSVEVKDPYVTTGASLTHYYGNGGVVVIPDRLHLTEIGSFAFANFDYVEKTAEELAFDDAETSKQWYIGENTVTKVVIPEGVEKINAYAFANLTALEEIVLPSTLEAIEYGAFFGCSSLKTITFSGENNLKIINQGAFENCALEGTLDLSAVCMISDRAFYGNTKLEGVITSESLLSIGQYAFAGCKKLTDVTITAPKVKYGAYAFTACEELKSFTVNAAVLPEGMFYECRKMESVTIGPDVNVIGAFAFRDTKIATLEVLPGNQTYKVQSANVVLSADGKTLAAVSPLIRGSFTEAEAGSQITAIGDGAFSHSKRISSVSLPNVTTVGDYGFGSSEDLAQVELGSLTHIGEYAFFETSITALPAITAQTELGKYAFSFTPITQVTIPDGMTVSEGCFAECMKLESVTIGDNVTLGKYAFSVDKDNSFTVKSYTTKPTLASPIVLDNGLPQTTQPEETLFVPGTGDSSGGHGDDVNMDDGIEGKDEEQKPVVTDSGRRFYYELSSGLKSLTIGKNAVIGDNAFAGAASIESITLGEGATIGYMSFYNNSKLKEIDLSKALSIGDYAFSGDVYYICLDDSMTVASVSSEGRYEYTYHAAQLESIDLSAAADLGEFAFAYCRSLKDVVLGDSITEIPEYAFGGCIALETINLDKIKTVGPNAFSEDGKLGSIDLSSAEDVGDYAFVYAVSMDAVKLNPNGTNIGEGAFSYTDKLAKVENLNASKVIGDYAFAYAALTGADLTAAEHIGSGAFLKDTLTDFTLTLGDKLTTLGDNPFAMCRVDLNRSEATSFNGVEKFNLLDSYTINDQLFVEKGGLYCLSANGPQLITYAGDAAAYTVPEGTVRISSMAFAGSEVELVILPSTLRSIGHKAFYACENLNTVALGSYQAPILEEEFDPSYYNSLAHIPGSGDFGTYTDYDGTEVTIEPMEILPYFMWNATGGMFSNCFYGANFVDYVGAVEDKLTMVRPVNGQGYDTFIYGQYFGNVIHGAAAPDDNTVAAIAAINAIGEKVSYEDRHLVEAARAAYDKVATLEQKALVTNYSQLVSAEQRIIALTPVGPENDPGTNPDAQPEQTQPQSGTNAQTKGGSGAVIGWIAGGAAAVAAIAGAAVVLLKKRKSAETAKTEETEETKETTEE